VLVRLSKSIHNANVRAVRKSCKDTAFAAKVNQHAPINGGEALGRPLDDVIAEVLVALQSAADRLGLEGTPTQ
jgi:predicted hydrolase (HD superfamily)